MRAQCKRAKHTSKDLAHTLPSGPRLRLGLAGVYYSQHMNLVLNLNANCVCMQNVWKSVGQNKKIVPQTYMPATYIHIYTHIYLRTYTDIFICSQTPIKLTHIRPPAHLTT